MMSIVMHYMTFIMGPPGKVCGDHINGLLSCWYGRFNLVLTLSLVLSQAIARLADLYITPKLDQLIS